MLVAQPTQLSSPHAHAVSTSPQVMGVINVTPDSFYDGGKHQATHAAIAAGVQMAADGAAWLDIGGESTRPGAAPVTTEQELARVLPVIQGLRREVATPLSIDTSNPIVMQQAVDAGATLINDVRALQRPGAAEMAVKLGVTVCLMHMQNKPQTMQCNPSYHDVVAEVYAFLQQRKCHCLQLGMAPAHIMLDPGFGFGKTLAHNCQLLGKLDTFLALDSPLLVGLSRKSMIGEVLKLPVTERLSASLGLAVVALMKGASIFRVHDVADTVAALTMAAAVLEHSQPMSQPGEGRQ